MYRHGFTLVALILLVAAAAAFPHVSIEVADGRMAVTINSKLFTALNPARHARRFSLDPVRAVVGTHVAAALPMETALTLHADWVMPTGEAALVETRTMTRRGEPDGQRIIDIDVRFTAGRPVAPEDSDDRTLTAEGVAWWERLRGSRSPWID